MIVAPLLSIVSDNLVLFRDNLSNSTGGKVNSLIEEGSFRSDRFLSVVDTSTDHSPRGLVVMELRGFEDSDVALDNTVSATKLSSEV